MFSILHRQLKTVQLACRPWPAVLLAALATLFASPVSAQVAVRTSAANQPLRTGDALVLKFKASPRTDSQVVRVGDLVEVLSWGRREIPDMLEMPLAPAPPVGKTQEWTSQELMRQLVLRGIPASKLQWSGSDAAALLRINETVVAAEPKSTGNKSLVPAYVESRLIAQAESNLIEATREYLWLQTGDRTAWHISLEVPAAHAAGLAQRRSIESIAGGAAPWIGPQQMTYLYNYQGNSYELELIAEVEPPQMVVVASRPIRREEVIDESALTMAVLPERLHDRAGDYFDDFEQVVGKQLRRSISTGLPIPRAEIGEPIVISSGELIAIESVSGLVSVKSAGRALSGGAVGDLINVELLPQRKRLTAVVVGPQSVRISGGGARLSSSRSNDEDRSTQKTDFRSETTAQQARRTLEGMRR